MAPFLSHVRCALLLLALLPGVLAGSNGGKERLPLDPMQRSSLIPVHLPRRPAVTHTHDSCGAGISPEVPPAPASLAHAAHALGVPHASETTAAAAATAATTPVATAAAPELALVTQEYCIEPP